MNGIEKIISRIEADARAEMDAICAAGQQVAAEIDAQYRAQAEAEAAALLAKAQKAAAEREERLVSAARMEGRKTLLAARQEMVEMAFQKALEELCTLPHKEYVAVLATLLRRAATGGEEVIFSKADRERVGVEALELVKDKALTLSEETRPIRGGFILRKGSVEVNCAFETLVRLEKGKSAAEVAKRLFPQG